MNKYLLKFVNAEMNQVITLTDSEFLVFKISNNCTTLLDAPMGVQRGYKYNNN